ncbi:MAG: biotin-dependent carboxyltransferase family protein, partial [Pseudomonadota bacterium]
AVQRRAGRMTLAVLKAGLQSTLQGAARTGLRHMGVPWSGPADPLSMALANRLVGNPVGHVAIEITLGRFSATAQQRLHLALTGAEASATLDGAPAPFHTALTIAPGQRLDIAAPARGMRTYLAAAGGFVGDEILGSTSTYLPAGFGGRDGRALKAGDTLDIGPSAAPGASLPTPNDLRPYIGSSWSVRATSGPEISVLDKPGRAALFEQSFTVGRLADRMGLRLEHPQLDPRSDGKMTSAAVFPGTVQCPENGQPIIMLCDAQTTGGYPRIAQVALCDRHMLGQVRPGDRIRFLKRTPQEATSDVKQKSALLRAWMPDFSFT